MPLYECSLCNISTKIKTHYNRHLKTQKHIRNVNEYQASKEENILFEPQKTTNNHNEPQIKKSIFSEKEKYIFNNLNQNIEKSCFSNKNEENLNKTRFICDLCNKELSTKSHLLRHKKKYCTKSKDIEETKILKNMLAEQKNLFEEERKHLYKHIETLLDKVGDTTINNTQHNNIQLNSYGNEDLSHITDTLKSNLLKMPYAMIPKLIEAVHFSKDKPENKNIALTNKKENKIKIYSNNKWVYKNKDETINDLMDGKYFILDSHCEHNNLHMNENYETFRKYYDDGDKELVDNLRKQCELVLLNNR